MCYNKLKEGLINFYNEKDYKFILNNCIYKYNYYNEDGDYCICGKNINNIYILEYNNKDFLLGSICINNIIDNEKGDFENVVMFKKILKKKCLGCKKIKIDRNKECKNEICKYVCKKCRIDYENYKCKKCKTIIKFDKKKKKCAKCKGKCLDCNIKLNNNKYDKCFKCNIKNKRKCVKCNTKYVNKKYALCYPCFNKTI